ncbi:hypothetical protein ThrDRAFT_03946 [Frankia casuarinae]|nr:hypothetical protein CcI6DRAFT_04538 [Frankia sp. CcI6]EYT90430.1 hypothetical protein ThrDRAFT_03946 [Frankia casuarinae]KFB02730.1 hypothetical protein ALLO2DRAFT_04514 [Frankia sp. Allo2]OAA18956.1 hypothetical protein AAY23_111314 [Frankia casuarinae]
MVEFPRVPLPGVAGVLVGSRPRPVAGGGLRADVEFVERPRAELVRVALGMAGLPRVGSVVVCPPGAPPGRMALAFVVAGLLRERCTPPAAVVTCAARPTLGVGKVGVPHEVRVETDGDVLCEIVYQVIEADQVSSWLAGWRRPTRPILSSVETR